MTLVASGLGRCDNRLSSGAGVRACGRRAYQGDGCMHGREGLWWQRTRKMEEEEEEAAAVVLQINITVSEFTSRLQRSHQEQSKSVSQAT